MFYSSFNVLGVGRFFFRPPLRFLLDYCRRADYRFTLTIGALSLSRSRWHCAFRLVIHRWNSKSIRESFQFAITDERRNYFTLGFIPEVNPAICVYLDVITKGASKRLNVNVKCSLVYISIDHHESVNVWIITFILIDCYHI